MNFGTDKEHEYSDNQVSAWGGMQEMKMLMEKTGISIKLPELGLPTIVLMR